MSPAIWIAAYMPILVLLCIILPQQRKSQKLVIAKIRKRKGSRVMTNELIKKYIGENCRISTGQFENNVTGRIVDVNENWLEVETKKGKELINADYVQSIKIM